MTNLFLTLAGGSALPCAGRQLSIVDTGAVGDDAALNPVAIQKAIRGVVAAGVYPAAFQGAGGALGDVRAGA